MAAAAGTTGLRVPSRRSKGRFSRLSGDKRSFAAPVFTGEQGF